MTLDDYLQFLGTHAPDEEVLREYLLLMLTLNMDILGL